MEIFTFGFSQLDLAFPPPDELGHLRNMANLVSCSDDRLSQRLVCVPPGLAEASLREPLLDTSRSSDLGYVDRLSGQEPRSLKMLEDLGDRFEIFIQFLSDPFVVLNARCLAKCRRRSNTAPHLPV